MCTVPRATDSRGCFLRRSLTQACDSSGLHTRSFLCTLQTVSVCPGSTILRVPCSGEYVARSSMASHSEGEGISGRTANQTDGADQGDQDAGGERSCAPRCK
ncbi:unnamed protein product [Symbiodinium sp. CCMP2592]|nr:unnamed protein product [Symbiodinium sp. CCMP2592]